MDPPASEPEAQTPGLDPLKLVGRAVSLVGPALMPLVFGGIILMVLVSGARQRKRAREAVLQHRATDALRKPRPAIVGAPAREQPASSRQGPVAASPPRPQTTDVDLPPPVVGGAGRAVIEHKGTGWCGCIAAAALIAGLAALIPWLLRTLDVL